jgi:uncharacterized membrane protein
MSRVIKAVTLLLFGGGVYCAVELLWRGHTHWTMCVLGGVCFLLIGGINEYLPWEMGLVWQSLLGAAVVTLAELAAGLVINVWLGLGVWDYSALPFNLWGQICPQYALAWIPLSAAGIAADDWLRWKLFGEYKPRYTAL